jgi:hypothetical protein
MGKFFPIVLDPKLNIVDQRDTIAKVLFGDQIANQLFMYSSSTWIKLFNTFFSAIGVTAAAASLIGVPNEYEYIGYISLITLPGFALHMAFFNIVILKKLLTTFTFWALNGFILIFFLGGMAMVKFEPPRVIVIFVISLTAVIGKI